MDIDFQFLMTPEDFIALIRLIVEIVKGKSSLI